jgi:hypothetical protein
MSRSYISSPPCASIGMLWCFTFLLSIRPAYILQHVNLVAHMCAFMWQALSLCMCMETHIKPRRISSHTPTAAAVNDRFLVILFVDIIQLHWLYSVKWKEYFKNGSKRMREEPVTSVTSVPGCVSRNAKILGCNTCSLLPLVPCCRVHRE